MAGNPHGFARECWSWSRLLRLARNSLSSVLPQAVVAVGRQGETDHGHNDSRRLGRTGRGLRIIVICPGLQCARLQESGLPPSRVAEGPFFMVCFGQRRGLRQRSREPSRERRARRGDSRKPRLPHGRNRPAGDRAAPCLCRAPDAGPVPGRGVLQGEGRSGSNGIRGRADVFLRGNRVFFRRRCRQRSRGPAVGREIPHRRGAARPEASAGLLCAVPTSES